MWGSHVAQIFVSFLFMCKFCRFLAATYYWIYEFGLWGGLLLLELHLCGEVKFIIRPASTSNRAQTRVNRTSRLPCLPTVPGANEKLHVVLQKQFTCKDVFEMTRTNYAANYVPYCY